MDPKIGTFLVLAGLAVGNFIIDVILVSIAFAGKMSPGAAFNYGLILFLISIVVMVVKIYRMVTGK